MSLIPWKSLCGRKYLWQKLQMLNGASHQPDTSSWMAGSLKAVACFLASSHTWMLVSPLSVFLVEWPELYHCLGGCLVLGCVSLDPFCGVFHQVCVFLHLGLAWPATIALVDRVMLVFGQAPPVGVVCCWSLSSLGGLEELMAQGQVATEHQSAHQWYLLLRSWPNQWVTVVCFPGHP